MKTRGFTLVELLAVLVIISALALITIPSILNYVNKHKGEISEVTEKLIYTGIEQYVEENPDTYKPYAFNQYCTTLKEVVDANYLSSPIIDTSSGKEVDLNQSIQINYDYKENSKHLEFKYQLVDSCTELYNDAPCSVIDGDGTQIGNQIACGKEEFYIISKTATDTTMLAKYNLNVGDYKIDALEGIQNENLVGHNYVTVPFSDIKYWSNQGYIFDKNEQGINKHIKDYEIYLKNNIVGGVSARLLRLEELTLLGCDKENTNCSNSPYAWLYATDYWTGTAQNNSDYIWTVASNGPIESSFYSESYASYGVRPVVKIPNSKISGMN